MIGVEGVAKVFTVRGAPLLALDAVSCTIEAGSFVTLVGPSGCGKSTLLQLIAGLLPPTRGSVIFRGAPVNNPLFDMVYVFQQYTKSIYPWKTVKENVAFGLRHRKRLSTTELDA